MRAARLRRRVRRGRRPLTQRERAWLVEYERRHPSHVSVTEEVQGSAQAEASEESAEEDEGFEEDEPDVEPAPAGETHEQRIARAEADRVDHGTSLLIRSAEMNERVSDRALALMERMENMLARQSEQLIDALTALADARAQALTADVHEAEDVPAEGEREQLDKQMMAMLRQKVMGLPQDSPPPEKTAEPD